MSTSLEKVKVNGDAVEAMENSKGLNEIFRKRKSGDGLLFDMDYQLDLYVQEVEETGIKPFTVWAVQPVNTDYLRI